MVVGRVLIVCHVVTHYIHSKGELLIFCSNDLIMFLVGHHQSIAREYQAILSFQLGNILLGCGNGFSAMTVPAIKEEMR